MKKTRGKLLSILMAATISATMLLPQAKVSASEDAAAKGESKEPKVPWRVRAEPAVAPARSTKRLLSPVPRPSESRNHQGRKSPIF